MIKLRKSGRTASWLVLFALLATSPALAGEMTATWKNGLKLSDDAGNSMKIGGRVYVDWAWFNSDDDYDASGGASLVDGTEFRTVRLFAEGAMHEVVVYKLQFDVAGGTAKFKDVWVGLKTTPLLGMGLKVGQFKQPFGLEELTSSKYVTFMERSQTAGFAPSRESGFQLGRAFADEQMTFHASLFRETNDQGKGQSDAGYGFAGRLTGLAWQDDEGGLLHLGVGIAHHNPDGNERDYGLEPEAHLQPEFAQITVPADGTWLYDAEAAVVLGPFSVQGEYLVASNTAPDGLEDSSFSSWYGQASWFVTGESRPYKKSEAAFDRVKPKAPYGSNGGTGAFEVAARFSSTDLNDGTIEGGTLDALTLGTNWYLNPNTRVMLNWVRSDGDSAVSGVTDAVQARFQVDF